MASQKVKYLVADTTAFINKVELNPLAENILTVPDVVDEVRHKRQIKRLCVLPFDLQVREPKTESVQHCSAFAKRTGDFASLSSIDIKVIALAYELEVENLGAKHLRTEPVKSVLIASKDKPDELIDRTKIPGFYTPRSSANGDENSSTAGEEEIADCDPIVEADAENANNQDDYAEECDSDDSESSESLQAELSQEALEVLLQSCKFESDTKKAEEFNFVLKPSEEDEDERNAASNDEDVASDDSDGWITPSNVKKIKESVMGTLDDSKPVVACMTTDYALQNVLKQLNLKVCALDGREIKQLRTYILRCYTCFKTTSVITKIFCPNCGHKTLKRVAVSIDEDGKQVIHINTRRPLTAKYKNQSLPLFRGGKHSHNPILTEDQPIPRQMPSRVAKTKTNALDEDYTCGYSPFAMRDVDSKSAILRGKGHLKEWARNNAYEEDRRKKRYNRLYK